MHKRHLTASALLASALVLTACGSTGNDTAATGGSTSSPGSSTPAETAKGNDADTAFLTGMKPHHEQAVTMSEMVLAADPPAEVAAIAQQIKGAQDPEIEQISTMLEDLGQQVGGGGGRGGGHGGDTGGGSGGHGGMMSDAMMGELDAASGTKAARRYLEGMVEHHQGAIEASDMEIADGQYEPAVALARTIKAAQTEEISEMQALLTSL